MSSIILNICVLIIWYYSIFYVTFFIFLYYFLWYSGDHIVVAEHKAVHLLHSLFTLLLQTSQDSTGGHVSWKCYSILTMTSVVRPCYMSQMLSYPHTVYYSVIPVLTFQLIRFITIGRVNSLVEVYSHSKLYLLQLPIPTVVVSSATLTSTSRTSIHPYPNNQTIR